MEHGVQFLLVAEEHSARNAGSVKDLPIQRWQRFVQLELPYATIGLVWNSMVSVAGGWFFLMACEMFVLGHATFVCRAGLVSADRGERGRYRRDSVGPRDHDRGNRADRSNRVATGHRVGREVQVRAGGEHDAARSLRFLAFDAKARALLIRLRGELLTPMARTHISSLLAAYTVPAIFATRSWKPPPCDPRRFGRDSR